MRQLNRFVIIFLGVIIALALVIIMIAFPVPRFPTPTGPYQIGTRTYHWVDASRPEPFTADPQDRRELMVQVWYPAEVAPDTQTVPYLAHPQAAEVWAPEACRVDSRFQACLAVDAGKTAAVVQAGLNQPVMIISRDAEIMRQERERAGGWPEAEIAHTIGDQRKLFERSHSDAYFLNMDTMYHINWTDMPILTPLASWLGLAGPINPYRGFAATNAYTVAFFDQYLKGQPPGLLRHPLPGWPEVEFMYRTGKSAPRSSLP